MSIDDWPQIDGVTALSRSGATSPGGKLVARIDIPVTEELDNAMAALAGVSGIPKAEMGRRILERVVFGEMAMLRRFAQGQGLSPSEERRDFGG